VPYFELKKGETGFPPAHFADLDGLLAVGGDMTSAQLIRGYESGVYYWHHPMKHIKWWSPDPRLVLETDSFPAEGPLLPEGYSTSVGTDFEALLRLCQQTYNEKEAMGPAWLSERMFRIFMELFGKGMVHAQEIRTEGRLAGGFFGICLGDLCFGEYTAGPASGAGLYAIAAAVPELRKKGIRLIDMQKETARVGGLDYGEISRPAFVDFCRQAGEKHRKSLKTLH
jgi:leucyl/phenylalanyl-tRNA--protein transferase